MKILELPWASCGEISTHAENERLAQLAAEHRTLLKRPLRSIEIGTLYGATAAALAQQGIVFCVDLWGDIFDGEAVPGGVGQISFPRFIENMLRLGLIGSELEQRVFPVVSSSIVIDLLPDMNADLIYVDACHYLEPVRADIRRAKRHLNKTGLFIFHDYTPVPGVGVIQAVNELIESKEFEVFDFNGTLISLKRSE